MLDPGVYTLDNLRTYGRKKGWCPYYLARHMLAYANVIVYNYQYMLDPKARCHLLCWFAHKSLRSATPATPASRRLTRSQARSGASLH